MPDIFGNVSIRIVNAVAWALDYWYVVYWQLNSFFIRSSPGLFRQQGRGHQPVILIPGIYEHWRFMQPVAKILHQSGYDVHVVPTLGYNLKDIEVASLVIRDYIIDNDLKGLRVVAHSKGGLIAKQLLVEDTDGRILHAVTINTPYSGSKYAAFIPLRPLKVFLPSSPVLTFLAAELTVNASITSVYSVFDPHIPEGSFLQGADNRVLALRGHFRILKSPLLHGEVLAVLKEYNEPT